MSILFELCATSLYEVLHVRKQHLAMEYALSAIQQIGLGIFYLHQCTLPVLHLDLKSANVLLDEHGTAKARYTRDTREICARYAGDVGEMCSSCPTSAPERYP